MNQGGTPAASSAPIIEPPVFPTTESASAGSQPVSVASAWRPPVSQAPPITPPAPRTSPILIAGSVRQRLLLIVVFLGRVVPRGALVRRLDVELVVVRDVRIGLLLRVLAHG